MRKTTAYIFLLMVIALFFTSCYKDGGNTFNAKSKIVGYWSVENLTVNGADSTDYLKSQPNYCEYPIIFGKYGIGRDYPPTVGSECVAVHSTNYWELKKHKKQITIDFREGDSTSEELIPLIFNEGLYVTWNIVRLKDEQMWLQSNIKSKEYFIKFYNRKPIQ